MVPGTVVPMGPNRSPCRSPISQSSRLRRAGWCSSSSHISPGHLQPLLQLQNRRLPTFCLLQVVQRHPLTIEALHPIGVGLEFEPAVDVVLDALSAVNLYTPLARDREGGKTPSKSLGRVGPQSAAQSAPHSHSCVERAQASVLVDGQLAALCSAACEGFR